MSIFFFLVLHLFLLMVISRTREEVGALETSEMTCRECGYDQSGLDGQAPCPECGTPDPRVRQLPATIRIAWHQDRANYLFVLGAAWMLVIVVSTPTVIWAQTQKLLWIGFNAHAARFWVTSHTPREFEINPIMLLTGAPCYIASLWCGRLASARRRYLWGGVLVGMAWVLLLAIAVIEA